MPHFFLMLKLGGHGFHVIAWVSWQEFHVTGFTSWHECHVIGSCHGMSLMSRHGLRQGAHVTAWFSCYGMGAMSWILCDGMVLRTLLMAWHDTGKGS